MHIYFLNTRGVLCTERFSCVRVNGTEESIPQWLSECKLALKDKKMQNYRKPKKDVTVRKKNPCLTVKKNAKSERNTDYFVKFY